MRQLVHPPTLRPGSHCSPRSRSSTPSPHVLFAAHLPDSQVSSVPQRCPQVPQFVASDCKSGSCAQFPHLLVTPSSTVPSQSSSRSLQLSARHAGRQALDMQVKLAQSPLSTQPWPLPQEPEHAGRHFAPMHVPLMQSSPAAQLAPTRHAPAQFGRQIAERQVPLAQAASSTQGWPSAQSPSHSLRHSRSTQIPDWQSWLLAHAVFGLQLPAHAGLHT